MFVVGIKFQDNLCLDVEALTQLYEQLGINQAEDLICRTFERLSVYILGLNNLHPGSDVAEFERIIHDLIVEAQNIGLTELAMLAINVLDCRQANDFIATAATLARLQRVSEPFLASDSFASSMLI